MKHPSGKRYTRTDALKRVVVEWANDLETQIRRGDFVDPNAGRMTLADWWGRWSETRVVQRATASKRESLWRVHVAPAFGTWPLATIQSWDVEAWLADMARRDVGGEAAASAFRLLKQLLAEATRHKLIRGNPAEVVKTPKTTRHVDRTLSGAEITTLLENVTRPGDRRGVPRNEPAPRVPDPANQLFVTLMLDAGLRWQEAAGLHAFRVDLMRQRVRVQEVVERGRRIKPLPKSDAGAREVPLTDDLVADLSVLMAGRARDELLFAEADGRPLDYSNWLKRVWNPAVAAAGLSEPLPTPHDCRHSYGSWLADEGVPVHEIAALMGHASLRAVERYTHASEARMGRAREAVGARRAHGGRGQRKGPASTISGNGA
ncbi:tyrosine-type recombinase/integrase [Nocardioides sp. AX2bis]|uniref:tyrosine-type recombinase/integrase n=1 Tax=Nocardioides sp. AX2bis TaxID=2653157 RepID=UPI00135C6CB8|nr:tyrosine-type recombinase/integrase [Nocardioides sp. AX2bis]